MTHRRDHSNATLDDIIKGTSWNRSIPFAVQLSAFPLRDPLTDLPLVTPAEESDKGRGNPVLDAWCKSLPVEKGSTYKAPALLQSKIDKQKKNPRNVMLTCGTSRYLTDLETGEVTYGDRDRHIEGVIRAVREKGTEILVVGFNFNPETEQWYRLVVRADAVLRENDAVIADGKHGRLVTLSKKINKYQSGPNKGQVYAIYRVIRLNVAPMIKAGYTRGWVPVDAPTMPVCHVPVDPSEHADCF
jgi:hypothetical protein